MTPQPHIVAEAIVDLADADAGSRLSLLVRHCVRLTGAAAAAAATADPDGRLRPGAATHEAAHRLMSLELAKGSGPGVESFRKGHAGSAVLLTPQGPWPALAEAARHAGFAAVEALPFHSEREPVGVLSLYSRPRHPLPPPDRRLAQALADIAAITIAHTRAIDHYRTESSQLQRALDSRVVIEQAKGILAERHRISVDDAFARLRRWARAHNERIHDVAADIILGDPR